MRFPSPIRFLADRRGNVAMMYALLLPVLLFGAGFAIDYTHAKQVQTKLDAAADAAVLAALTPSMMEQSNAAAQTAATNLFTALANAQTSLIAADTVVTVQVCSPTACSPGQRTVTVSYTAANQNIFSSVLGASALQIAGSSTANASIAPNINFYLLLDNSPSMALPQTSAGIATMESLTPQQDGGSGCAFACHMALSKPYWNPSNLSQNCTGTGNGCVQNGDIEGNPCLNGTTYTTPTLKANLQTGGNSYCAASQGTQIDNYALARHNNIPLRMDAINTGVGDLMTAASTAEQTAPGTPPVYKFAAYTMDSSWQVGMSSSTTPTYNNLMAMTNNFVSGWTSASPNFTVMEYYGNNYACGNSTCTTDNTSVGDWATNYENALGAMNTIMPTPGNGTNTTGDTPQEVLFIVTDGVADELSPPSCSQSETGSRCQEPINTALCTTIKNRGIRIAILYTDYLPVPTDSWYESWIEPFNTNPPTNSQIATNLQTCASTGLFYDAGVDSSNLGADLQALFNTVTATAHLTQ
jgi:Flp pilus assembly protein TadG